MYLSVHIDQNSPYEQHPYVELDISCFYNLHLMRDGENQL